MSSPGKRETMKFRTVVALGLAAILMFSLLVMGGWMLLSVDQGTMMGQGRMMGPESNRGVLGGYVGSLGILITLLFLGAVGLLLVAYLWERPGLPEPAECPNCERPVETDWTVCPYCGGALSASGIDGAAS